MITTLAVGSALGCHADRSVVPQGYLPQTLQVIEKEQRGAAGAADHVAVTRVYQDAARDWSSIPPPAGLATAHAQVGQAFAVAASEAAAIDGSTQDEQAARAAIPPRVLFGPFNLWLSAVKQQLHVIPGFIDGPSMNPALCSGDIVDFTAFDGHATRWDIALVSTDRLGQLVKRIVGLPGETIMISQGAIYVDGRPLDDHYQLEPPRYSLRTEALGADEYLVLGDNRNNSDDSHDPNVGAIRQDAILGLAPANLRGCK